MLTLTFGLPETLFKTGTTFLDSGMAFHFPKQIYQRMSFESKYIKECLLIGISKHTAFPILYSKIK